MKSQIESKQNLFDFALQEQPEGNLMVTIPRAWNNNGSYTMAAKSIKSLELHYTMIQFLIITHIPNNNPTIPYSKSVPVITVTGLENCTSEIQQYFMCDKLLIG